MIWRDELAAKIAADDKEEFVATFPDLGLTFTSRTFEIAFARVPYSLVRGLTDTVNDRECCGVAPGLLLIECFNVDRSVARWGKPIPPADCEATMYVSLGDRPWNERPTPDGWVVLRDADGKLTYPAADFGMLDAIERDSKPETWHDRPPML